MEKNIILTSLLINETLNKTIKTTEDLQNLHILLDIILKNMDYSSKNDYKFVLNFAHIYNSKVEDVHLLKKILKKALLLSKDVALVEDLVMYIIKNQDIVENQKKVIAFLDVLCKFCHEQNKLGYLFTYLKLDFITNFLLKISTSNDSKVEAYEILRFIFPLLSNDDQVYSLNLIYTFCQEKQNLDIFCAMLNQTKQLIIDSDACCLNDNYFFYYLEDCLSGDDIVLRKQASAILIKYINEFYSLKANQYICVAENHSNNSWDVFFILLDIAREKQLHLVEPALNLFTHIMSLHPLWRKCIYTLYLNHSQNIILYRVAIHLMENFEQQNEFVRDLIKLLLKAINKHEYSDLTRKMFTTFRQFCLELNKDNFVIVLEEILLVSWTSVALWKVVQNIFNDDNSHAIHLGCFNEIICCVNKLPHVFIRNECIKVLVYFFRFKGDVEANWSKLQEICGTLNRFHVSQETYFQLCEISHESTEFLLNQFLSINEDTEINRVHMSLMFLQKNLDNQTLMCLLEQHMDKFNYRAKLLIWHWYCQSILPLEEDKSRHSKSIKNFMTEYFTNYLTLETVDYFLTILIVLEKYYNDYMLKIALPKMVDIIDLEQYSNDQTYIAIALLNRLQYGAELSILISKVAEKFRINMTREKNGRNFKEYINLLFRNNTLFSSSETMKVLALFKAAFDDRTNDVIEHVCKFTKNLLKNTESPELVSDFIYFVFGKLKSLKKDKHFKMIICRIFETVFCDEYLDKSNSNDLSLIGDYLVEICGSCALIRARLMKILTNCICTRENDQFSDIFESVVEIYLQGMVITKDERIEYDVCQEFLNNNEPIKNIDLVELSEYCNPNMLNIVAKYYTLNIFTVLARRNVTTVTSYLRERYLNYFKKRYHKNSEFHYKKLRIAQALLLTIPFLKNYSKEALQLGIFLFDCFLEETNQHCVRQLFSLIIVKLLQGAIFVGIEYITRIISFKVDILPSTLITLIPILYHLLLSDTNTLTESCEAIVNLVLPWTMGPQFKLRLYAQDLIKKVLLIARENNLQEFLGKFESLELCLQSILDSNQMLIESTFKSDKIFLENFKITSDYCLKTIFYDIPRLNNVGQSEWENSNFYLSWRFENTTEKLPIHHKDLVFSNSIDTYLSNKISKQISEEEEEHVHINIKKKIIPCMNAISNKGNNNFILIASLIDKPQNLGGLCRTCEVFGIQNLNVNNIQVLHDKEFKSLSVSSETYLNISEIKIQNLRDNILEYQKQGYLVIGAEQTLRSEKLNEFQFPKKIVLLLGNEKTGIPTELLPLLNVCLEIPQIGQTRSLNVHVAGAIFIWEYAKQHLK